MNNRSRKDIPPGFRFHPTEEELVNYYLRKKIYSKKNDQDVIKDVELCKIEPWDLQDICGIGGEEQHEWYFFSHRDKKYLTGSRTNRATKTGFWKATGRDKPVWYKSKLVGMRKTLVFYNGRAPNGKKTDWVLHEYRLQTYDEGESAQEDDWAVCRVFKKKAAAMKEENKLESRFWYVENMRSVPSIESQNTMDHYLHLPPCSYKEQFLHNFLPYQSTSHHLHLPQVNNDQNMDQRKDWRALEQLVASQLSQDDLSKYSNCNNLQECFEEQVPYYASSLPTV